jgi:phenylacetate-CoA ligase
LTASGRTISDDATPAAARGAFWDKPIETMSRDELGSRQFERLRWQLERCYGESALYRQKFQEVGAEPRDLRGLADLAGIPPVTKEELRLDQERHPPYGSFVIADSTTWRELHPSSGTTGAPVKTIWSARDVETITDYSARTLWQFGVRPGDIVQNSFAYGLWVAGISSHYAAARVGALVIPLGTSASTKKQVDYLLEDSSTVLLSTPSYALHIAEELERQSIDSEMLSLRIGCFGGEAGAENPSTRAIIERSFGIDAFDYYGLAEIGPTFASECSAKAGLHFAEDHVLVECLDPDTNAPVPAGEAGVLVFTHLTRQATPMIRYWSNDYGRLTLDPCPCGRTHLRAVGGVLGRHDDLIIFKGAKFYPSQVEKVVRSFVELSPEFRVEVEREAGGVRLKGCTVVVESAVSETSGLVQRLRSGLRAELGVTPSLRIESINTLERTAFKSIRLIER